MRVQFFPGVDLEKKLQAEAASKGVSLSVLVVDVLTKYYGLVGPNKKSEAQLEIDVFSEIASYVATPTNIGTEFDLNKASKTYTQIEMICEGRPHVVKARIGKAFSKAVRGGESRFSNVQQVFLPSGKPKRTVANRAAIYRIGFSANSNRVEKVIEIQQ